jgi:soluble cytochrome b562
MKTTVVISPLFVGYAGIRKLALDKIVQACEAVQNARQIASKESSGTLNRKSKQLAESAETVNYTHQMNVVTAFIQYAEAEVGSLDKANAKLEKLGCAGATLTDIPATLHGFDVNAWLQAFAIEPAAKPEAKPATEVKPQGEPEKPAAKPAEAKKPEAVKA